MDVDVEVTSATWDLGTITSTDKGKGRLGREYKKNEVIDVADFEADLIGKYVALVDDIGDI